MRTNTLFFVVILLSTVVAETAAQTLSAPQAVTDPKKISSQPNAQVEARSLTVEKLWMTRQVGRAAWSPEGFADIAAIVARAAIRRKPQ